MMGGKGDTCQKRKGACVKVQRVIIRAENGALLTPSKRGTHQGWKKSVMRIGNGHLSTEKWPQSDFDRGIYRRWKRHLWKGDRSLIRKEKGHVSLLKWKLSKVKRGTYRIWKGEMTRYEKGHLCEWKRGTHNKENVHKLTENGHRSDLKWGIYGRLRGHLSEAKRSNFLYLKMVIYQRRGTYEKGKGLFLNGALIIRKRGTY